MIEEELNVENPGRRFFLKLSVIGAAASLAGYGMVKNNLLPHAETDINDINKFNPDVPDDPNRHWGFMIDLSKCDGCENLDPPSDDPTNEKPRCAYACRTSHGFLGANPPQYWIRVHELEGTEGTDDIFFPLPCQNCQDAPCKRVCPTGATYQREDGTILINHEFCIGCRICMAACPYEARFFWFNDPPELRGDAKNTKYTAEFPLPHTKGTVAKCDLCIHNIYNNQPPHCVSACPKGALYFGDFNEDAVSNARETLPLNKTLNARGAFRYKEEEGTETSVYYLPVLRGDDHS